MEIATNKSDQMKLIFPFYTQEKEVGSCGHANV